MKLYYEVYYELLGYKGKVLIGESIKDENEIKEICARDYFETHSFEEVKILKKERKEYYGINSKK